MASLLTSFSKDDLCLRSSVKIGLWSASTVREMSRNFLYPIVSGNSPSCSEHIFMITYACFDVISFPVELPTRPGYSNKRKAKHEK